MEQIIQAVLDAIPRAGLVEVEVSARHVHLTREHLEILFGKGAELTPKRPLSQPGQLLSEERVTADRPQGPQGAHRDSGVDPSGHTGRAVQERLRRAGCQSTGT